MPSLRPKFYFLAPVSQIPPKGPITLGSIISLPRLVAEPINDYPVSPESFAENVYQHNAYKEVVTINRKTGAHGSIFAEFLHTLGISGQVQGEANNNESEKWSIDKLQTIWFTPSTEYVKKSLEDPDVQEYLCAWLLHKRVYMVTGIKIAYGASSTLEYAQRKDLKIHVGFDFTPLGVPIIVGPEAGMVQELTVWQTQGEVDPFVFAFRLRQIKVHPAGDFEHEDFSKGALLRARGSKVGDERANEVKIIVEGLDDFDIDGSDFLLPSWDAIDELPLGGTTCKCAKTR